MMYLGEFLNAKSLAKLNRVLIVLGVLFGLTVGAMGVSALLARTKISTMKEEIAQKSKAIVDAQNEAKKETKGPTEKPPMGLAAVNAFQNRLNKLAQENACSVTQFQGSDQMNPFISTFSTAAQSAGTWTQVEVRMNLTGSTRSIVQTLRDMDSMGIPYEFTSIEMSRTGAGAAGDATLSANVTLRVLTIPGGA